MPRTHFCWCVALTLTLCSIGCSRSPTPPSVEAVSVQKQATDPAAKEESGTNSGAAIDWLPPTLEFSQLTSAELTFIAWPVPVEVSANLKSPDDLKELIDVLRDAKPWPWRKLPRVLAQPVQPGPDNKLTLVFEGGETHQITPYHLPYFVRIKTKEGRTYMELDAERLIRLCKKSGTINRRPGPMAEILSHTANLRAARLALVVRTASGMLSVLEAEVLRAEELKEFVSILRDAQFQRYVAPWDTDDRQRIELEFTDNYSVAMTLFSPPKYLGVSVGPRYVYYDISQRRLLALCEKVARANEQQPANEKP